MKTLIKKTTTRTYYKNTDTTFVQPTLSENGTMGGDSFAVSATAYDSTDRLPYKAMDGSLSTIWHKAGGGSYFFYNPYPLKVSKLTWRAISYSCCTNISVYGSNDGVNYELILTSSISNQISYPYINVNSTKFYKYYKMQCNSYDVNGWGMYELYIEAIQRVTTETTSEDYDYYVDVNEYDSKVIKNINKYYAIN